MGVVGSSNLSAGTFEFLFIVLAQGKYSKYPDDMHKRWWIPYGIIALLLLPIVLPMYTETILGSADNLAHLFRVVNLDYALSQGYIWPRWAALEAHGFGAPIFNFNYMLPYYVIRGLWQVTGSLIHASQLYMMLTILGSSIAMYMFAASVFTVPAALVAAIVYAYTPYHLMTIYLYSGYGEALAFVWVPLFAHAVVHYIKHPEIVVYRVVSVMTLSALILTHNLSALMAIPFVYSLMFGITSKLTWAKRIQQAFATISISALLTAWFWLPSVAEQHLTKLSVLFEKETALRSYFFQIIAPIIENSIAALRFVPPSYYSYAIGIPTLLISSMALWFLTRSFVRGNGWKHEYTRIGATYMIWFIATICMTRAWSEPLWKLLPAQMNFLSYPYRFFFLNSFASAMLAAYVIMKLNGVWKKLPYKMFEIGLIIFVIWQGIMYAHPAIDRFSFGEKYFSYDQTVREAPYTHKNMGYIEFIPRSASSDFVNGLDGLSTQPPRAEIISGSGSIRIVKQKAQALILRVKATEELRLRVNILYFAGWTGLLGRHAYIPTVDNEGRMIFTLPKGEYDFYVVFANTPIRTIAIGISIGTALIFLVYMYLSQKNLRYK